MSLRWDESPPSAPNHQWCGGPGGGGGRGKRESAGEERQCHSSLRGRIRGKELISACPSDLRQAGYAIGCIGHAALGGGEPVPYPTRPSGRSGVCPTPHANCLASLLCMNPDWQKTRPAQKGLSTVSRERTLDGPSAGGPWSRQSKRIRVPGTLGAPQIGATSRLDI